MRRFFLYICSAFTLLLGTGFSACDDDDDNNDSAADADADGDGDLDIDGASLTHAADIQPIWDTRCGGCHLSSSEGGLNLVDGFESTVGAAAP